MSSKYIWSYFHVNPTNKKGVGSQFALWKNVAIGQLQWNMVAAPGIVDILIIKQRNY